MCGDKLKFPVHFSDPIFLTRTLPQATTRYPVVNVARQRVQLVLLTR